MPMVRKLVRVGNAKAITLPKSYVDYWEKKHETKLTEMALDIIGEKIYMEPVERIE